MLRLISATVLAMCLSFMENTAPAASLKDALAEPYAAPEIAGIEHWINSAPLTSANLQGKVVLVDFWAYSCVNCVRTLPYLSAWNQKYRDKGLVIIGVHAPEFEFEKSPQNVERAVHKWHVDYPVALDNSLTTWKNFNNRYWPAHYLINQQGQVVYTHFGEGSYDVTENNIRQLLGLDDMKQANQQEADNAEEQTPETYLGYARAAHYAGSNSLTPDNTHTYTAANALPLHHWTLQGDWKVESEHITSQSAGATLTLHFHAQNAYLVMGAPSGKPQQAELQLDGKPLPPLTVDAHTLYTLVKQETPAEHTLTITATDAGLEAYAFTFGK